MEFLGGPLWLEVVESWDEEPASGAGGGRAGVGAARAPPLLTLHLDGRGRRGRRSSGRGSEKEKFFLGEGGCPKRDVVREVAWI